MTNLGKWDTQYANMPYVMPMGDSPAYEMGARALAGCAPVEDWGTGYGWFKHVFARFSDGGCIGVDGSRSPGADVVDDLTTRSTSAEGIFMRGVLEHNYDWQRLLDNALHSFTKCLVVVIFTPFTKKRAWPEEELRYEDDFDVPTLALSKHRLLRHFKQGGRTVTEQTIDSPNTAYGTETIFVVTRG